MIYAYDRSEISGKLYGVTMNENSNFFKYLIAAPLAEKQGLYERTTGYKAGEEKDNLRGYLAPIDAHLSRLPDELSGVASIEEKLKIAEEFGNNKVAWLKMAFYHAGFSPEAAELLAYLRYDILTDERCTKIDHILKRLSCPQSNSSNVTANHTKSMATATSEGEKDTFPCIEKMKEQEVKNEALSNESQPITRTSQVRNSVLFILVLFGAIYLFDAYPKYQRVSYLKKHLNLKQVDCNHLDDMYIALKKKTKGLPYAVPADAYELKKLGQLFQPPLGTLFQHASQQMLTCGWENLDGY